jgi:hypothetical protein
MAAALVSASQSSVIKLHWLTFGDTSVEPGMQAYSGFSHLGRHAREEAAHETAIDQVFD